MRTHVLTHFIFQPENKVKVSIERMASNNRGREKNLKDKNKMKKNIWNMPLWKTHSKTELSKLKSTSVRGVDKMIAVVCWVRYTQPQCLLYSSFQSWIMIITFSNEICWLRYDSKNQNEINGSSCANDSLRCDKNIIVYNWFSFEFTVCIMSFRLPAKAMSDWAHYLYALHFVRFKTDSRLLFCFILIGAHFSLFLFVR